MDQVEVSSVSASSESICPICGNLTSSNVLHKWGIDHDDLEYIKKLLEDGSFLSTLRLGELASKHLDPDRLTTDVQVRQSLETLSRKAEELLKRQREHIEKITELEREDKKGLREEAFKEQKQIIEDYQKKLVDLQQQAKEITDRHFAETQQFTNAVRDIREKIVGPGIGSLEETSLAKELKSACPHDDFSNVKASKGGADIVAEVREGEQSIGKVVVSSKADDKWKNEFREQLRKNLEQERTRWGILVTKSFPSDALNDKAYLDDEGMLLVKFDYAPVAYLGMRQAVIHWHEAQTRLIEAENRIKHEKSILQAMREWVSGEKFSEFTDKIDDARKFSKETDDTIDDWESYSKRQSKKVHQMQQKLRLSLGDCDGLLDDLRTRFN